MLGQTLEWVELPNDIVARLEGRSSLGRLGLLIHSTAGYVDPGWKGNLTLELSNVANLPIALYYGMSIGQISFFRMTLAGRAAVRLAGARLEVPGPVGADGVGVPPRLLERAKTRRLRGARDDHASGTSTEPGPAVAHGNGDHRDHARGRLDCRTAEPGCGDRNGRVLPASRTWRRLVPAAPAQRRCRSLTSVDWALDLGGGTRVALIQAGTFRSDAGALFGPVPRILWNGLVTDEIDDEHRLLQALNCLLVETPAGRVLVETGIGERVTDKVREMRRYEGPAIAAGAARRPASTRRPSTSSR